MFYKVMSVYAVACFWSMPIALFLCKRRAENKADRAFLTAVMMVGVIGASIANGGVPWFW